MTPETGVQTISVIIPTLARGDRAAKLRRAIESVVSQEGVRAVPLVVVNGSVRDPEIVRELRANPDIRLLEIDESGIPSAFHAAFAILDTPYCSGLDDDDLLLPGALALRIGALAGRPDMDAVVTNGYRNDGTREALHVNNPEQVQSDPLRALLSANWLLPGSWLARTDRLSEDVFRDMPRYLECTYLAVRLASAGRMLFLNHPTVVWHTNDPSSVSKSWEFQMGELSGLRRLLTLEIPPYLKSGIRRKIAGVCHSMANRYRRKGQRGEAWRWHLRSLKEPGGWRYLPFSRHLLLDLARGRGE
jgi:glycosyltransferase involved in cell wall biosynthesis